MLKEWRLIAALALAPIAWAVLYWYQQPRLQLSWPLVAPWRYFVLALIYPVVEEMVFRGGVQGWLRERVRYQCDWWGISRANLYTSLLFTALHFVSHPPLWAIAVFIPSLIFGYFRDRYGGIARSTILHIVYNAGFFLLFPT